MPDYRMKYRDVPWLIIIYMLTEKLLHTFIIKPKNWLIYNIRMNRKVLHIVLLVLLSITVIILAADLFLYINGNEEFSLSSYLLRVVMRF